MARKKRSDSESSNHDDGVQFRISEVSSLLNVSASTLRQWENVGLTAPSRTKGGYRVYSGRQVKQLKRIQSLRVKNGLNIGAIRQSLGPLEKAAAKQSAKAREVSIGRRLRQLRRTRKLTLAQGASATEVSAGFLSCLERGQVHALSPRCKSWRCFMTRRCLPSSAVPPSRANWSARQNVRSFRMNRAYASSCWRTEIQRWSHICSALPRAHRANPTITTEKNSSTSFVAPAKCGWMKWSITAYGQAIASTFLVRRHIVGAIPSPTKPFCFG
jgi:DNA-binding transcriptional MerR regulator